MDKLQKLEHRVRELYEAEHADRADWGDWLADNHVFVVAGFASELAKKYSADENVARAAALLHDIADYKMKRSDDRHPEESLRISRELMRKLGFTSGEIAVAVDDAIRYHSCHGDEQPESLEGKILSTADSMAHLKTDFYLFATYSWNGKVSFKETKKWVLGKIERDMNNKMFFDEVRQELLPDYKMIKELFSR